MGGRLREERRPTAKPKCNLRGKRLDPCRGANASPKAKADPVKMAAVRILCRRAGARFGGKCRRVFVEPGSEASLNTPCGKPRSRPCYEAVNSVAAENSVGELTAGLRAERLMFSTGMRAWRTPFPNSISLRTTTHEPSNFSLGKLEGSFFWRLAVMTFLGAHSRPKSATKSHHYGEIPGAVH